jgi:hypothetical protein
MPTATASRRAGSGMLPGAAVGSIVGAVVAAFLAILAIRSTSTAIHYGAPALLGGVAVWMFFSERYERTLAVLALYLGLFDGFLKLKTGSEVATLGRDVLLYSIAAGALVRIALRRQPIRMPKLSVAVFVWVVICLAEVLNPVVPSITHALAGVRQHVEFVPLFFLGYAVMRSKRRFTGMFVLLVVVASVNGIVALIQSRLPLAQLASWGPGYAREVYGNATVTGRTFYVSGIEHVRPPALGSDLSFGGTLAVLAIPAVLALGAAWGRSRGGFVIALIGGPLVILALVTSQSRTAVVSAVVAVVVYLFLTATTKKGAQTIATAAVLGAVAYVVLPIAFPTVASGPNRYASIAPSRVISTAIAYRSGTLSLLPHYIVTYPLGDGIGNNGPAAGSTVGGSALAYSQNAESEFNFLALEVGAPGLLLLTALTVTLIALGIRLRRISDVGLQRSLMVLVAVNVGIGASWFVGIATASTPTAPFFWFTAGAIVYWYGRSTAGSRTTTERSGRVGSDAHGV